MELPLSADTLGARPPSTNLPTGNGASPAETEPTAEYVTHRRFDRAGRLFSEPGLQRLMQARVLIVGVGGIGSFAAEAASRSGIGTVVLIDFDRICITNTNRQLHAMKGTIGKSKVEVMAERLRAVHPTGTVEAVPEFYDHQTSDKLLSGRVDYVIDAIDNVTAKTHLIATCLERNIPLVSCMGAAARIDPTKIRVGDLAETKKDPFASAVRKVLRSTYGINAVSGHRTGVDAVYSIEEPIAPSDLSYDEGVGFRCVCPGGKNNRHDCERRARIDGTASFVTGSFGLMAASVVVRKLLHR